MVDGLERPGYEIPVCSQQVQKKGRTWDDATTAEDTTMEVVEAVSLEKAGVVPGVRGAVKDLRSAAGPYFKDKLLGSTGGSKIGLSLGELDVEGRLEHQLPISALESLTTVQPPKPQYGADIP
ncbi:hypothetical protein V6N13_001439 [Hibiscus sabdariffa]